MFLFSCVSGGLAVGCSPFQGVLPTVCKIQSFRLILNGNRQEGLAGQRKKKKMLIRDHVTIIGEMTNTWDKIFAGKPERKKRLEALCINGCSILY
jgi:hypothetical protein